jgi:predicted RNase H-like HicB family nuclease
VRFDVTVEQSGDGFVAECESLGCTAHGLSPTNALESLREEIRYRLELCPCTTVNDDFVELNVVSGL